MKANGIFFYAFYLVSIANSYSQDAKSSTAYYESGLKKYNDAYAKLAKTGYYLNPQDFEAAVADLTKSIEIIPSYSAYHLRANARFHLHNYSGAIVDLTRAIDINPTYSDYYLRGNAKLELKDYNGAIADYSKTLEMDSPFTQPDPYPYYKRGKARYYLKDYKLAIEDFSKTIEIDAKLADAYYYRGEAKQRIGQKDSGCLDFSKAGELGNESAYAEIERYCNPK